MLQKLNKAFLVCSLIIGAASIAHIPEEFRKLTDHEKWEHIVKRDVEISTLKKENEKFAWKTCGGSIVGTVLVLALLSTVMPD